MMELLTVVPVAVVVVEHLLAVEMVLVVRVLVEEYRLDIKLVQRHQVQKPLVV